MNTIQPLNSTTMIATISELLNISWLPVGFNSMSLDEDDNTYLHHIVKLDIPKSELLINNLIMHHTILDHTNRFGQTVFHLAAAYAKPSILRILLTEPADFFDEDNIDLADNVGNTVAHYCSTVNLPLIVESGEFDINRKNNAGLTPLLHAICCADEYKVKKLLELGAEPNCCDSDGNNALHYAVNRIPMRHNIINALLECGTFRPNRVNNQGKTPLDCAIDNLQYDIVYKIWSTWLFVPDDLIKHVVKLPECEMKDYLNNLLEARRSFLTRFI